MIRYRAIFVSPFRDQGRDPRFLFPQLPAALKNYNVPPPLNPGNFLPAPPYAAFAGVYAGTKTSSQNASKDVGVVFSAVRATVP